MTATTTATNNKAVRFRGEVAHEMTGHGEKLKAKRLPAHARKAHARGLISEKQMSRLRGGDDA